MGAKNIPCSEMPPKLWIQLSLCPWRGREESLESFPGAAGSDSMGPTRISSSPRHTNHTPPSHPSHTHTHTQMLALPAFVPAWVPALTQPGTPGQQGGGDWRRGVKLQSFSYISIGQGLSKTTASPSLGKCLERNQGVPNKCFCTGSSACTSKVCEEA